MIRPAGPEDADAVRRLVHEDDGALAGLLVLEDAADTLLLDNVAVAPAAQGEGHGRAMVIFAEAEARRHGHARLRLYTDVLMTENLALYGKLGFQETAGVSEKGYERVYMVKELPP